MTKFLNILLFYNSQLYIIVFLEILSMYRLFFILMNICQIILFIIAYLLDFLSRNKMGVMRHFVYKNNRLNEIYNMEYIMNIVCFTIILITMLGLINLIIFIFKKKNNFSLFYGKYFYIVNISLILLGLFFIIFLKYFSIEKILTYYYINLIFLIIYLIEFIKVIFISLKSYIKINY